MKPVAMAAVSLLIAGALGWFLLDREPVIERGSAEPGRPQAIENSATATVSRVEAGSEVDVTSAGESSEAIALRQRIVELTFELEQLATQRSSAEAQLQQAERDVAALERFIEEIEERGEDPVDYADEGLAMYQPAFNAYQDAEDKLASVEARRRALAEELAVAENELEKHLFDEHNEQ